MKFYLTDAQEECLREAVGQPVGRKGEKWLAWANRVLKKAELGSVATADDEDTIPETPLEPKGKSKAQQALQHRSGKISKHAGAAAVGDGGGIVHIHRTFVVESATFKAPGMTITFNEGIIKGYFVESRETRSKALHDPMLELTAVAAGGTSQDLVNAAAAAAAGGGKEAKQVTPAVGGKKAKQVTPAVQKRKLEEAGGKSTKKIKEVEDANDNSKKDSDKEEDGDEDDSKKGDSDSDGDGDEDDSKKNSDSDDDD